MNLFHNSRTIQSLRLSILLACMIIIVQPLFSQSGPSVIPVSPPSYASPNAAALGKYGDIPISYHTGTTEVSIPIYTISEGSLSLPVSLSYHSSGVTVPELASWTGLGWSLNAGGMITRMVHGGPDEGYSNLSQAQSDIKGWGFYKNGSNGSLSIDGVPNQLLACEGTIQNGRANGPGGCASPPCVPCGAYYFDASQGYIDLEPDLYTFNFNGYSGKFFFDYNRQVHLFPEDDFYIQPVNTPSYFYAWTIRTPDGVKYYFGGSGATEVTANDPLGSFGGPLDQLKSTTWYLYRIESPNGEDWITLTCADESYSYGNRNGQSITIGPPGNSCYPMCGDVNIAPSYLARSLVSGKRLTQVTTRSGNTAINFIGANLRQDLLSINGSSNNSAYRLDTIKINSSASCSKKFNLNYSYFQAYCPSCMVGCPSNDDDTKRLKLNSVQETDCAGSTIPPYIFTYNATPLPRRLSLARDFWDYYNGADCNTGLIDRNLINPTTNMTFGTTNDRSVSETMMQAGILTRIQYPTGGSTTFS